MEPAIYDPTANIFTPYEALTVAETIMQMATVGLGSGADQVSDGGVWESQAAGPLAAFLYAASPMGNNEGMDWVLRAVDNIDTTSKNRGQEARMATGGRDLSPIRGAGHGLGAASWKWSPAKGIRWRSRCVRPSLRG